MSDSTPLYNSVIVPRFRLEALTEAIEKLQKRADKLGVPRLYFEVTDNETEEPFTQYVKVCEATYNWDGVRENRRTVPCVEVRLGVDSIVKLAGWRLVAVIEHMFHNAEFDKDGKEISKPETLNLIREVPGETMPAKYRDTPQNCDHCGYKRRRNKTFVLAHDDGQTAQVGSTCLSDYLGVDASRLTNMASFLTDFVDLVAGDGWDDYGYGGGRGPRVWPIRDIISFASAAIETYGYCNRKNATETRVATAVWVESYIAAGEDPKGKPEQVISPEAFKRTADLARKANAWLDELKARDVESFAASEGYQRNLAVLAKLGYVRQKDFGILVSVPFSIRREEEKAAEQAEAKVSEWQGKPKDKLGLTGNPLEVKVIFRKVMGEDNYGYRHSYAEAKFLEIVKFEDRKGNRYTWWTTTAPEEFDTDDDGFFAIIGTVKNHQTDKYCGDAKVTNLTRVVWFPEDVEKARDRAAKKAAREAKKAAKAAAKAE